MEIVRWFVCKDYPNTKAVEVAEFSDEAYAREYYRWKKRQKRGDYGNYVWALYKSTTIVNDRGVSVTSYERAEG